MQTESRQITTMRNPAHNIYFDVNCVLQFTKKNFGKV